MQERRFIQCDVFTSLPAKGNGLAVVLDGEGLSDVQSPGRLDEEGEIAMQTVGSRSDSPSTALFAMLPVTANGHPGNLGLNLRVYPSTLFVDFGLTAPVLVHARTPKPVSLHYRFDWTYAVRASRFPALRPASFVIALMPVIQQFVPSNLVSMENIWLLWFASVSFLVALAVLRVRCPEFVQEYQYYGQFEARGNSHRWIVWEFFYNLHSLSGWQEIVKETIDKQISFPSSSQDKPCEIFRANPVFPPRLGDELLKAFKPVNLNRDIYLPIWLTGNRFVLPLQETDPDLSLKVKELFWILVTQAAGERKWSRILFWIMFAVAVFLFCLSILNNVLRAATGTSLFGWLEYWWQAIQGVSV